MTIVVPERRLNRRERKAERDRVTARIEQGEPISLVASAVNVRVSSQFVNMRWGSTDWQQEAWLHYDTCPEFRSGVALKANAMSRARLIGVQINPETGEPDTQPTDDPTVRQIMGDLFGGPAGQSQALAQLSRHLDVAGDCWVLATDQPDADQASWEILGTTEVTSQGQGNIQVRQLDGLPRDIDTDEELLVRIWQPHPARRWDADSMARPLLPVLRELAALTAMVSATVKSRLASAGILWLPDDLALPTTGPDAMTENSPVRAEQAGANAWLEIITEAMTAPISDPDSASAVVPLIATVKGDMIEKISHMEFGRDLDDMIEPLRTAGVQRLAVGMSLPAEYLNGQGDINHWTGWLIAEDFNRFYLAPMLELIADALTRYYLRPSLRIRGLDPDAYAVYFDLDALLPKQISVDNADKAYAAGLLTDEDYLAVLGFSPAQMPTPEARAIATVLGLLKQGSLHVTDLGPATLLALFPGLTFPPQPSPLAVAGIDPSTGLPIADTPPPAPLAIAGAGPTATGAPPNGGAVPPPPVGTQ